MTDPAMYSLISGIKIRGLIHEITTIRNHQRSVEKMGKFPKLVVGVAVRVLFVFQIESFAPVFMDIFESAEFCCFFCAMPFYLPAGQFRDTILKRGYISAHKSAESVFNNTLPPQKII